MATDERIEQRRELVKDLLAHGASQIKIAHELNLTRQTIAKDIKAINKEAMKMTRTMAKEGLDSMFHSCIRCQNDLILQCWAIWGRDNSRFERDQQVSMNHRIRALELIDRVVQNKFNTMTYGPAMMEINRLQSEVANLKRGIDVSSVTTTTSTTTSSTL